MSQPKYPGEIVNRRLCVLVLSIAAFVSAGFAQSHALSPMTRQVREVTLNGQAALLGRLPATQTMQLNVVLPLRDQAGLDAFLADFAEPEQSRLPALPDTGGVHRTLRPHPGGL